MNPSHPGVALGPIGPIGVVAAPGPGGPIGLGIGVMTSSAMVSQMGQFQSHPQKKLVSPDSSDDKDKYNVTQIFAHRSSPTSLQQSSGGGNGNPMTWSNPLLSSGMGYPVMGMNVMGPNPSQGISDASILYGLISTSGNGPPNMNISNSGVNIPVMQQNSQVLNIPQMNSVNNDPGVVLVNNLNNNNTNHNGNLGGGDMLNIDSQQNAKDIIHCKSCTLFPPNPTSPKPTTREKPNGCRTVFVGGLPENATECHIREIFDRCGEIATIRLSKKNFCHIRFELEQCIEAAVYLSGYRVRIGSNSDPPNIGRLHVDYAQARDDLYEYECRQRQLLREQRHRERIEQERLRTPSPPPIAIYSDHEALTVAEKIKSDDSLIKGIHILVSWLERGECIKRNSTCFYSMIQSTNSHVRRLLNEKSQYEEEMQKARDLMRQRMTGLLMQFSQIEKVFISACQKKAWDHFSKAQRKNIEMWRKQATEIKSVLLEEALAERNDEEMDLSDSDSDGDKRAVNSDGEQPSSAKKPRRDESSKTVHHLKEENDSLRCQLEASNNEVGLMKADLKAELESKDEQLKSLQKQISEQQNLLARYDREKSCSSTTTVPNNGANKDQGEYCDSSSNGSRSLQNNNLQQQQLLGAEDNQRNGARNAVTITELDARLIGIISTFLHVHPFGASLDYIWSYTQKVLPAVRANQIEALMIKFPTLFRQEVSGVGATLERKWLFVGFQ